MDKPETPNVNKAAFACCDEDSYLQEGLTKKEYLLGQALAGLCANPNLIRTSTFGFKSDGEAQVNRLITIAEKMADSALK